MNRIQRCETLMRRRELGWWEELSAILPELASLGKTPQSPEHHAEGDVGRHTRLALKHCPDDCSPILLWVALLHDIGKPETTVIGINGSITAHGHAKSGAQLADSILLRLGMDAESREQITWIIRHHMFPHSWQLKTPADLSRRQRTFMRHPWFPLLLQFLDIDARAAVSRHRKTDQALFFNNILATIERQD
nr:HD domain-containing protein [uncultured Desulfobulbus sp.]